MGIREGIRLGWSQGFELDELNVWQECWWQINLRLVNWRPQVGHKTLSEGWKCIKKMGVGWGVWSWPTIGTDRMRRGKCLNCAWSKGFEKV